MKLIFTSGTQALQGRTVSHDRMPYVGADESRRSRYSRFAPRLDPRPEFAVLDNPILAAFRRHVEKVGREHTAELAQEWLAHFPYYWHSFRGNAVALARHRAHARLVFAHLVKLED